MSMLIWQILCIHALFISHIPSTAVALYSVNYQREKMLDKGPPKGRSDVSILAMSRNTSDLKNDKDLQVKHSDTSAALASHVP